MSAELHVPRTKHPDALREEVLQMLRVGMPVADICRQTGLPAPTVKEWRSHLKDDELAACTVNSQVAAVFETDGVELLKQAMAAAKASLKRVAGGEDGANGLSPKQTLELSQAAKVNVETVERVLRAAALAGESKGAGVISTPSVSVKVSVQGVEHPKFEDLTALTEEGLEVLDRVGDEEAAKTPQQLFDELAQRRLRLIDNDTQRAALEQDLLPPPAMAPIDYDEQEDR